MKQVKMWIYVLILYICIVAIDLITIAIQVSSGNRNLPFGWGGEIGASMLKCIADLIVVVIIGFGVEFILKRIINKTLIPNVIITILIYKVISLLVSSLN